MDKIVSIFLLLFLCSHVIVAQHLIPAPKSMTVKGKKHYKITSVNAKVKLWNDVRVENKELLFVHNGMPNGLLAFAESSWCGGEKSVEAGDESILPAAGSEEHTDLLEFENLLSYHRDHFLYDWDMRWVANAHQVWKVTLPERRGVAMDDMEWKTVWGGAVDMVALCEKYKIELQPIMDAWMTTEIYSPVDTVVQAWVGFNTPFTPENEIPYVNELFAWMREPAVSLKSGWNKVKLYCPRSFSGESWCVTFIPVNVDENGHV